MHTCSIEQQMPHCETHLLSQRRIVGCCVLSKVLRQHANEPSSLGHCQPCLRIPNDHDSYFSPCRHPPRRRVFGQRFLGKHCSDSLGRGDKRPRNKCWRARWRCCFKSCWSWRQRHTVVRSDDRRPSTRRIVRCVKKQGAVDVAGFSCRLVQQRLAFSSNFSRFLRRRTRSRPPHRSRRADGRVGNHPRFFAPTRLDRSRGRASSAHRNRPKRRDGNAWA